MPIFSVSRQKSRISDYISRKYSSFSDIFPISLSFYTHRLLLGRYRQRRLLYMSGHSVLRPTVAAGCVEPSISPPSQLSTGAVLALKPSLHIREPSFAYGCDAIFEIQSTKQPSPALPQPASFYAGASLNSSQVLSLQDVFPAEHLSPFPISNDTMQSSDFGRSEESYPKAQDIEEWRPMPVQTFLVDSSVIRPPDFSDNEGKPRSPYSRTGLAIQRITRLKRQPATDNRLRGLSSPSIDRTGTNSSLRRAPAKFPLHSPPKKTRSKGNISASPFEAAYLPSLHTLDQRRLMSIRKPVRTLVGRRTKAMTPDPRVPFYVERL